MKFFSKTPKTAESAGPEDISAVITEDSIILPVVFGGFYATKSKKHDEGYMLTRIIDFNKDATHIQMYTDKPMPTIPTFAEAQNMQPKIWHTPIATGFWLNHSEVHLLGGWSLTPDDFQGYIAYLQAMNWEEQEIINLCNKLVGMSQGGCMWIEIKKVGEDEFQLQQVDAP